MYPSIITTFNTVAATDRLDSPSHSALHNSVSSVLTQVQTIIGTDASTLGTIIGDLRNANSAGGGHVQTAVKGGTGQTTFTKGDLLVAQSSSVLSKLAVGANGLVLTADTTASAGVAWANTGTTKLLASTSIVSIRSNQEGSVFSVSIPGSTLGTSNAIRSTAFISAHGNSGSSVMVRGLYGGNVVTTAIINLTAINSMVGRIEYDLVANNSSVLQRANLMINLYPTNASIISNLSNVFNTNTSSVNSSGNQTMGLVIKHSEDNILNLTDISQVLVEKII